MCIRDRPRSLRALSIAPAASSRKRCGSPYRCRGTRLDEVGRVKWPQRLVRSSERFKASSENSSARSTNSSSTNSIFSTMTAFLLLTLEQLPGAQTSSDVLRPRKQPTFQRPGEHQNALSGSRPLQLINAQSTCSCRLCRTQFRVGRPEPHVSAASSAARTSYSNFSIPISLILVRPRGRPAHRSPHLP